MPPLRMGATAEGQDLKELFDLYHAPDEDFARYVKKKVAALRGFSLLSLNGSSY
jgi:hypothetical protein